MGALKRIVMNTCNNEKKMRMGVALLCGLAVCCSVMYITADAGEEYVHEIIFGHNAGTSVANTDVLKAGQIYSETPDGRMRLMDYFNNVRRRWQARWPTARRTWPRSAPRWLATSRSTR